MLATSVKRARNGRPEGLPRGCGLTPREEMPCPKAASAEHARSASIARRVIIGGAAPPGAAAPADAATAGSVAVSVCPGLDVLECLDDA